METRKENLALDGPQRILVVGGRAIVCQPGTLDIAGRLVRPDLLPAWLHRPNRAERRARKFGNGRRGGG